MRFSRQIFQIFTQRFIKNRANIQFKIERFSSKCWQSREMLYFPAIGSACVLSFAGFALSFNGNFPKVHGKTFSKDDDLNNIDKRKQLFNQMNFIADIVEEVSPSVVFLDCPLHLNNSWLYPQQISSGSGFVVDIKDGIILTNAHVVANSKKVKVKFNNSHHCEGIVEFVDDRLDLATVRVPSKMLENLSPLRLAEQRSRAGEWVIAVGAPFTLSNTVTVGVISSTARDARELGINDNIDYIQTDASINVGNSGGPLLNLEGQVVGINTLKVGEGISFAVPSAYVERFLSQCHALRHGQHRSRSPLSSLLFDDRQNKHGTSSVPEFNVPFPTKRKYLGITIITLTRSLIESTRSSDRDFPDVRTGVLIYAVVLGSPAHICGLRAGDVIQKINGKSIERTEDVYRAIDTSNELQVYVRRKNEEIILKLLPQISD